MMAIDTSLVVAAFASWHEAHEAGLEALAKEPRIPSHVYLESYSVLTRLPPPHRASPEIVCEYLALRFPQEPLSLPPRAHRELLEIAARLGISGGSIYDAQIAFAAKLAGATLLTRDRRALATYGKIGVRHELVAGG